MEEEIKEQEVVETVRSEEKSTINPLQVFPWSNEKPEQYIYGDLHIWCRNCGSDIRIPDPRLQNFQTTMPINPLSVDNKAVLALGCEKCGSQMVLHWRNAQNPPKEEEMKALPEHEEIAPSTIEELHEDIKNADIESVEKENKE